MKAIFTDWLPADVRFFTVGKRYPIVEKINDYKAGTQYQVMVVDDNGVTRGPLNVGWPCAYLDDKLWSVEDIPDEETA